MSTKESAERPNILRHLTDIFANSTIENWEFNVCKSLWYLSLFLCALIFKLVSKRTLSSSTMSFLSAVTRSGRNASPIIMQGERMPGKSIYRAKPTMDWKAFAMNCNAELWRHVKGSSSRYVLQQHVIDFQGEGRRNNRKFG